MKRTSALLLTIALLVLTITLLATVGCTPAQRSPDNIRHDTAKATAEAAKDAKAVAQGVVDGLKTKGPMNINTATAEQLDSLPGLSEGEARHIIAGRPYANSDELVKRHIISRGEYDRIAGRIEAR
jgi:DNA uptake protein ComE-like DNA-binding protein